MTIYQEELLRRLPQLDCTGYYGYRDGLLHIFHGDAPFCRQTPEGFLCKRIYEISSRYHRSGVWNDIYSIWSDTEIPDLVV